MKRLQNRIAENGLTLPVAATAGLAAWLLAGHLGGGQLWPQLVCFAATVYLLIELSNANALLRVRSRMVSSTFIVLWCCCGLFHSLAGAVVGLCFVASLLPLFQTYQGMQTVGRSYLSFACLGVASMASVHMLLTVPLLWVLMATQLQSLNGRSWAASLLGLLTPYWLVLPWLLYTEQTELFCSHFSALWTSLHSPFLSGDMHCPPLSGLRLPAFVFVLLLATIGIAHFRHFNFEEKIRTRLLYGFFTAIAAAALLLVGVMPLLFDVLMPVALACASPLVAHVLTFGNSKLSSIFFFSTLVLAVVLMVFQLIGPIVF